MSPQTITATSFVTRDSSKTVGRKGNQEAPSTARRKGGRSTPQRSETVTTLQRADMLSLQPHQPPEQLSMQAQVRTLYTNGASMQPLSTLHRSTPHRSETVTTLQRADMLSLQPRQPPEQLSMQAQVRTLYPNSASMQPLSIQPLVPYSPSVQYGVPASSSSPSPSTRKASYPSPSYGAFIIYPLPLFPPQVSICYGCSAPLKPGGKITPPPGDLVIVSNMMRSYTQNNVEQRKQSNV
ncbi:hypothetical protein OS493_012266 [Desmophyllum pertusum]|uniref:Uncharacterized protein n=1 Tax=Desmophyllum pertusum TaxID=174260 RepID=A0A9W9ZQ81_9CNID|nr:hypothetical protein OS493_012266 [Desmophyllum pertusum]